MRVCVTGARGFIGSHVVDLLGREGHDVVPIDVEEAPRMRELLKGCDATIHLAGVNRGESLEARNAEVAKQLISSLEGKPHVIVSSSVHREQDSDYGRGKRAADERIRTWGEESGAPITIAVIPNVFGVGCRPFYNSVVATFCHQLARGEKPSVKEDRELELISVETVARELADLLEHKGGTVRLKGDGNITVSELLVTLERFMDCRKQGVVPDLTDPFERDLYVTLDSYVENRVTKPIVHADKRGELFELVKLEKGGQVFFSTSKPGVVRGNHFHTRKIEKFCVVQGEAVIRLRKVDSAEARELRVSAPAIVDIPAFHAHNIENVGTGELLTLFWSSEIYDPQDADSPPRQV